MKKLSLIVLIAIASCNNNGTSKQTFIFNKDTIIRVSAVFENPYMNDSTLHQDIAYIHEFDTLMFTYVDSNTQKKQWIRFYQYYIPTPVPVIDSITKKQKLDSVGKPINVIRWLPVHESFIHDRGSKNVDSLIKEFRRKKGMNQSK